MKNVLTTVPKSKFKTWPDCEAALKSSDGSEWGGYWLVNTNHLPKECGIGGLCYMVFAGQIRGYMDIVDVGETEGWREVHDIGKPRTTQSLILANWHSISPLPYTGFQGWRYTELRP